MTAVALQRLDESTTKTHPGAGTEMPLRLLLLRDRSGELPWVVQTIKRVMAPVEVVEVRNLANAVWRLGRERFDTVLLDLTTVDRSACAVCRRHIADVAAVPVLDLHEDERPAREAPPARAEPRAVHARRAAPPRPQPAEEPRPMLWPPRVGRRRGERPGPLGPAEAHSA